MRSVLVKPLLTEKMTGINTATGKYGFLVALSANKIEIAKAIEKKFNVDVVSVNTVLIKGKSKTQFTKKGRFVGKTNDVKKAIITLKKDQKIDIFEQV
ncbi:MAG: 50S ribosomal protein L23 [Ignavibacteriaceae bacterium]|nr:50S ribosomal protein L23 [Ignavibacteriaceae bacterium]HRI47110.1 50S ribosomal protein L23 [Ignavibacteriaceae bacterium]